MTELSKKQIIEYMQLWGNGSVIESILDPSCQIFSSPTIPGLIGYLTNSKCVAAFGDPVCSPENRSHLVDAFHAFCDEQKKSVVYLIASENFAYWMHDQHSSGLVSFGSELYLDPQNDPLQNPGKGGIALRGKIRHANKHNVVVREYGNEGLDLENKIQEVATNWIKGRRGPQVYSSQVRLFAEREGKRWFYAVQGERLVGSVVLNKVKEGWALDRIMTVRDAPQGTSELLVVTLMDRLAEERCSFLTFGATNSASLGRVAGFGKCASFLLPKCYRAALKVFKLEARGKYWDKFHPESTPAFLVFKEPRIGPHEVRSLIRAFNVSFNL